LSLFINYWTDFVVFKTVYRNIFPQEKPTRCTISQIYFILEQHSTYFGRSLRPSSGV